MRLRLTRFAVLLGVLAFGSSLLLPAPPPPTVSRIAQIQMGAKAKKKGGAKAKKKAPAAAGKGFGAAAKAPSFSPAEEALVAQGKKLKKTLPSDPRPWFEWASACASEEEYAEARMILEAGAAHCGEAGSQLVQALGQMRRTGYESDELAAAAAAVDFPGKDDETPYEPAAHRFARYDAPQWPPDCPRGTYYPTGEGAVALSLDAVIDPSECAWVVARAEEAAASKWSVDHANKENIGTDKIWSKPFPDRLWLREVPGLLDWFEHRLRTRLFPMLQASARFSARATLGARNSARNSLTPLPDAAVALPRGDPVVGDAALPRRLHLSVRRRRDELVGGAPGHDRLHVHDRPQPRLRL